MEVRLSVEIQSYILRAIAGAHISDAKRDAQYFANLKRAPVIMIHNDTEYPFAPQREVQ